MLDIAELETKLKLAYESKDVEQIKKITNHLQFPDIADVLEKLSKEANLYIFNILDAAIAADVLVYLESRFQKNIIEKLPSDKLKEIINTLHSDDLIDIIDKFPSELVQKVLQLSSVDLRKDINKILKYDEDTAGGMMSVEYLKIFENYTISQVLKLFRDNSKKFEIISDLFIINKYGILKGYVSVKNLLIHDPRMKICNIMDLRIVSIDSRADREEVISAFKRYDVSILPVVNSQNKIIGTITIDDVIDGLENETTEDITKLAGIQKLDDEYFDISIWKMFKSRSTWLLWTLLLGTISQILIIVFLNIYGLNLDLEGTIGSLTWIIPMLLILAGTIGISANQAATVMVRALSINEVGRKDVWRVLAKEIIYSLMIALFLILVNLVRMILIYLAKYKDINNLLFWKSVFVSSLTLFIGILLGNMFGTFLPIWAKKIKLDPTLVCGPFITTTLDIVTVSLLFGLGIAFF